MRIVAETLITNAATTAGLDHEAVLVEQKKKKSVLLPAKRLEIGWLPEKIRGDVRRFKRIGLSEDGTRAETRWNRYQIQLQARCICKSDEKDWLTTFCRDFLMALPTKVIDTYGNAVVIRAQEARRDFPLGRLVSINDQYEKALHITFYGVMTEERDAELIREIEFNPHHTYDGEYNDG